MSTATLTVPQLRPPRVNAAGVCVVCLTRCHDAATCVTWFATSSWIVCDRCGGTQWYEQDDGSFTGCGCWSGLVESCDDMPDDAAAIVSAPTLCLVASA